MRICVFALLSLLAVGACGDDPVGPIEDPPPVGEPPPDGVTLAPDAFIVDDATDNLLIEATDEGVLVFSRSTALLDAVGAGDVLILGVTEETPYGLLVSVTAVERTGEQVMLETEPAAIEDAVEEGYFTFQQTLTLPDSGGGLRPTGAERLMLQQVGGNIVIPADDLVVYDADDNPSTTYDQIVLDGELSLRPDLEGELRLERFRVEEFSLIATITLSSELNATFGAEISFEESIPVFPPIPLAPVPIGPFTLTPVLTVEVGAAGQVTANLTTGMTQSLTTQAGVEYRDGDWRGISDADGTQTFTPPNVTLSASAEASFAPGINFLLNGIIGPTLDTEFYLRAEVTPTATPWWRIFAGVRAGMGIEVAIWTRTLVRFEVPNLIRWEQTLGEAADPYPHLPPAISNTFTSVTGINDCFLDSGAVGSTSYHEIDYSDPNGDVGAASYLTVEYSFEGGGSGDYTIDPLDYLPGSNGYEGVLDFITCTRFGGSPRILRTARLYDEMGNVSDPLTWTQERPPGADLHPGSSPTEHPSFNTVASSGR